ncbi:hypothetical protein GOP47_0005763 [Adiantum capillus-veneris]|uniref:non-specific serine/threonine protein kinase n=2 Tax=Adiantum capillus-veneris TaxID=13818 RepID=A0A9D4V664_ADICA|nr:hypothetical protein GOP47_0005763 [Adiantum capillus-veneris]
MDFSFVSSFYPTTCEGSSTDQQGPPSSACCLTAFNTFGLGIALYLRESHIFELPDNRTLYACYDAYQAVLIKTGLQGFSVLDCQQFSNSSHFIRSPTLCGGIETVEDWQSKVGVTAMDSSCKGDLSDSAVCQVCNVDALLTLSIASNLSANNSDCFYFVALYAAGVINEFGPTNFATAGCLLALEASTSNRNSSHHIATFVAVGAAIVVCSLCVIALSTWLWCRRRQQLYHQRFVSRNRRLLSSTLQPNVGAIWYQFDDIKLATNNFSTNNLVGSGGFSVVYKGIMPDGSQVAVKSLKNCTKEGDAEFRNEVEVINSVRHRNLAALRGCCVASNTSLGHLRLLIYDYMPNGSLEDYLFQKGKPVLEWADRERIAVDMARGLAYLHMGVQPAIIHRDIKANNILLDEHLNAHVADFGLAKVTLEGMTHMTTRVAGTQGYLAPEYALYGQLTEKSDVYSFGVLLLVLVSGRQALDLRGEYPLITDWAWVMVKSGNTLGVVDERIHDKGPSKVMERFVLIGILCAHLLVAFRPTMAQAFKMLQGVVEVPQIPDRPLPLTHDGLLNFDGNSSVSSMPSIGDPRTYTEDLLR